MKNTGLVLEGGGMRGVFTGGILEFFLEKGIHFPYIAGVSAGACNAASYVSRQSGRNKAITVGYAQHPDYISFKRLIRSGELFNMDLIFDRIPNIENPFDYDVFFGSEQTFYVGVTDCYTGETLFYEKEELKDDFNKILRASSSLPMVAPIVKYDNRFLLDGGISDPIPVRKSLGDGNEKHIIILTQREGYEKQPAKKGMWYFSKKYKDYPGLVNVVKNRYKIYNGTLELVNRLEQEGKAFVIRPDHLYDVKRVDRNSERLEALFNHGYKKAEEQFDDLISFIGDSQIKERSL